MNRLRWRTRLELKIPELDAEHRAIYERAAALPAAGASAEEGSAALKALIGAIAAHFVHEEQLMSSTRYAGLDWHQKQHEDAMLRLVEFETRFRAGRLKAKRELLAYLGAWFDEHIGFTDRMMGAHLRNWALRSRLAS